ncbi:MAG TPA: hypothetical protein VM243_00420 [Phycisphaerae bacterium]|nr:hypothetical protein [Phycisphaerae bacterium]
MNGLSQILEQVNRFAEQHVPAEMLQPVVPAAVLLLAVGVVISVLGAKLTRPALTAGFGVCGAMAGGKFACLTGLPVPITVIGAALIAGGVGFLLYRLWIGVGAAIILAVIALSAFGYVRILPELDTFQPAGITAAADGAAVAFELPEPEEQAAYLQESPQEWLHSFWNHVTSRQPSVQTKLATITAGAALLGLLLGAILARPTLILYTSLAGTALVISGLGLLTANLHPELYRSALDHPRLLAGAGIGLLLSSLVLQARLFRRPPAPPPSQPAPKASR